MVIEALPALALEVDPVARRLVVTVEVEAATGGRLVAPGAIRCICGEVADTSLLGVPRRLGWIHIDTIGIDALGNAVGKIVGPAVVIVADGVVAHALVARLLAVVHKSQGRVAQRRGKHVPVVGLATQPAAVAVVEGDAHARIKGIPSCLKDAHVRLDVNPNIGIRALADHIRGTIQIDIALKEVLQHIIDVFLVDNGCAILGTDAVVTLVPQHRIVTVDGAGHGAGPSGVAVSGRLRLYPIVERGQQAFQGAVVVDDTFGNGFDDSVLDVTVVLAVGSCDILIAMPETILPTLQGRGGEPSVTRIA